MSRPDAGRLFFGGWRVLSPVIPGRVKSVLRRETEGPTSVCPGGSHLLPREKAGAWGISAGGGLFVPEFPADDLRRSRDVLGLEGILDFQHGGLFILLIFQ